MIEDSKVRRLGGKHGIPMAVRVVAATNSCRRTPSEHKQFREDLYYRLNVFHIYLPPLRERKEDMRRSGGGTDPRLLNQKTRLPVTGLAGT